ncbi:probable inactive receptor kinase At2g26730 [Hibiscus syriacus]|nr:probable inactive receptor kinase At2g26730 [Hibiscus syriacus]
MVGCVMVGLLLVLCLRKQKRRPEKQQKRRRGPRLHIARKRQEESNKLVFFESGVYGFQLEELLNASVEVLGKGSVGTSYKAMLEEEMTVVVKVLKDVAVSKREMEIQTEILGRVIKHERLVPLRAYYYSRDDKLLVYDFMAGGSLSARLHGSRRTTPLEWNNRLKIAVSTGRGLSYLHVSNFVHGNIKSSNILFGPDQEACISDYGLIPLFANPALPSRLRGYLAPEVLEFRRVTFKSDVYSFGVLLLGLLTGKSPNHAPLGADGINLPRWVQATVREEWTAEVFDAELLRYDNIEEEMVQLLQIAMCCVSTLPNQSVIRMIEDVTRQGTYDGHNA